MNSADIDWERTQRCGFPEVIYGEGKTAEQLLEITAAMSQRGVDVFATRVSQEKADRLLERFPHGRYNSLGRTFRLQPESVSEPVTATSAGKVAIVTAGTSDLPVAEEARETALWFGAEVDLINDVGVAGPQRLIRQLPRIQSADAVVVVAGMEGALPSVVGGYVDCPVIAVPTSVGYGANFQGLSALLGMLNSCASNVVVVNIDAGFKGGCVAGLIAQNLAKRGPKEPESRTGLETGLETGSEPDPKKVNPQRANKI